MMLDTRLPPPLFSETSGSLETRLLLWESMHPHESHFVTNNTVVLLQSSQQYYSIVGYKVATDAA